MANLLQFFLKNDPSLSDRIPFDLFEPVEECMSELLRDGFLLTYLHATNLHRKLLYMFVQGDHREGEYGNERGHRDYHSCMTNLEKLVAFMSVKGQTRVSSATELLSYDVLYTPICLCSRAGFWSLL